LWFHAKNDLSHLLVSGSVARQADFLHTLTKYAKLEADRNHTSWVKGEKIHPREQMNARKKSGFKLMVLFPSVTLAEESETD